jgi:hypothetical protein
MSWRASRRVAVTAAADGTSNFILDRGLVDIIGRPKMEETGAKDLGGNRVALSRLMLGV